MSRPLLRLCEALQAEIASVAIRHQGYLEDISELLKPLGHIAIEAVIRVLTCVLQNFRDRLMLKNDVLG